MEFDFTCLALGGEQHITAWDSKRIGTLKPDDLQNLAKLLDVFGKKSAVAQGLQNPITDIHKLRTTDQRIYLYIYRQSSKTVLLGGLKVGTKRLYVRTITADLREMEPTCVLDFYVHESCQRQGVGKALFEHFISAEGCDPACIAYDRPSPKLLGFLRKHYGLQEHVPQSNNFVVFNRYFELNPTTASGSRGGSQAQRQNSRGSVSACLGTSPIHPLHGRSTPPPPLLGQPQPVHPGWAGVAGGGLTVPSPSAVGPPPPLGQSPSFGQRWAASTFGPTAPSYAAGPSAAGQELLVCTGASSSSGYGAGGVQGGGGGSGHGDSLDAFSRAHYGAGQQQQMPPLPPGRSPAPWEAGPSQGAGGTGPLGGPAAYGGQPPGSKGAVSYTSRPPWAVDDTVGGAAVVGSSSGPSATGGAPPLPPPAPVYGSSPARMPQPMERLGTGPPKSPLQGILSGGGGGGGPGYGPHTFALQQQLAAMQQRTDAAPGGLGLTAGSVQGSHGAAGPEQQPWPGGAATPGAGGQGAAGLEEPAAGGRGAARITAVAQRSGAGAADCLVW